MTIVGNGRRAASRVHVADISEGNYYLAAIQRPPCHVQRIWQLRKASSGAAPICSGQPEGHASSG